MWEMLDNAAIDSSASVLFGRPDGTSFGDLLTYFALILAILVGTARPKRRLGRDGQSAALGGAEGTKPASSHGQPWLVRQDSKHTGERRRLAKTTVAKTTIAKTTATKTVKKPLSLKAQAAKRAEVKRNRKAGSKKASLQAKKKGIGLFAPVNLSAELAAICGGKKMPRTQVSKRIL